MANSSKIARLKNKIFDKKIDKSRIDQTFALFQIRNYRLIAVKITSNLYIEIILFWSIG